MKSRSMLLIVYHLWMEPYWGNSHMLRELIVSSIEKPKCTSFSGTLTEPAFMSLRPKWLEICIIIETFCANIASGFLHSHQKKNWELHKSNFPNFDWLCFDNHNSDFSCQFKFSPTIHKSKNVHLFDQKLIMQFNQPKSQRSPPINYKFSTKY